MGHTYANKHVTYISNKYVTEKHYIELLLNYYSENSVIFQLNGGSYLV